ncbi:MAG: hypothetical protein R3C68_04650 [Myxococcota bacterium]
MPDPVKPSLREVEESKQEKADAINQAQTRRNEVIPKARGQAWEAVATAEGYRIARLNHAKGGCRAFQSVASAVSQGP